MTNSKETKIGRRLLMALLAIHGLTALVLGSLSLINFPYALENGFGIPYNSEIDILGMVIGLQLLLLAAITILSLVWVYNGKIAGTITGTIIGFYLLIFGIFAFLKFGNVSAIYVDSFRGLLTIIFGSMAYRELQK